MKAYLLISINNDNPRNKMSSCLRGIFSSKELALETIIKFSDSINECGYYNYALIEERDTNTLDGHSSNEEWYGFVKTPSDNILVEKISKPEVFSQMSNFV